MAMHPAAPRIRRLWPWLGLLALLCACQTPPGPHSSTSATSSVLAVDVRFPTPFGRDHSLVQAFFVKDRVDAEREAPPEIIPATFVKNSRAYLLDPEPGSYELVAVASKVSPARRRHSIAGGVKGAVSSEPLGHVTVFPADLVRRTKMDSRSGSVVFMGAVKVLRGERINAGAVLQDDLQRGIAEQIRPGATSESGLSGLMSNTWMVDAEESSFSNTAADRAVFFADASEDLGESPWAQVVARAAPADAGMARPMQPQPSAPRTSPSSGTAPTRSTAAEPPDESGTTQPNSGSVSRELLDSPWLPSPSPATDAEPEPDSEVQYEPQLIAGIPPDSPLAQIEIGMHHAKVRRILGDPAERIERVSDKTAWIPFYNGPDARLIDWVYPGVGKVVFSMHTGRLLVYDAVAETGE